jgi:4'-phosphopantetheinyl transferase
VALRIERAARPWQPAPARPSLARDAVHIWRGFLDRPASEATRLRDALTPEERQRADCYHFTRDREHFIVRRGLLRLLLGRYLHHDPRALRLIEGPAGKPEVAEIPSPGAVRFNVSRSDGLVVLAFALDRHVGIDVERVRPDVAADGVAETFFAPDEAAALRALPASLQPAVFFDAWTRKEAYVKATGQGLTRGLESVRADGSHDEAGRWTIRTLHPGPGYAAALVVEGGGWELHRYDIDGMLG